jgi:outer membrane biogenesis lipoprotein LolB
MGKYMRNTLTILALALLTGCGDPAGDGDNVWKTQTDTIDRAREAEQLIGEAHDARRQQIDPDGQ